MVRPVSANSLATLSQNLGTEPVVIIEIQWSEGGSIYTYADKNINSNEGKILEVSNLDNTVAIQGVSSGTTGDSQQISVSLLDADSTIKDIIDNNDIHKRPAWVYQWFQGTDLADKFLLFKGQISSPITWSERSRSVTFDILTRIEDAEVGFSMEEGDFPNIPEDLVGESWPLVFGTVENMPALRTRTPRKGVLRTGFGIKDFLLAQKIEQLKTVCCPSVVTGWNWIPTGGSNAWGAVGLRKVYQYAKDITCECSKEAQLKGLEDSLTAQASYENSLVEITNGQYFEQGVSMVFEVNGARVVGYFNGTAANPSDVFVITNRFHPDYDPALIPPIIKFGCPPLPIPADDPAYVPPNPADYNSQRCVIEDEEFSWQGQTAWNIRRGYLIENQSDPTAAAYSYLSQFPDYGFFWAEIGSEMTLVNDTEISYVVNLLPSTVVRVSAYKNFSSGVRQLTTVPSNYYTVRVSDFNGYMVTEVVMTKPLSGRVDEGWEDDIYVSHISSVGPNTIDIIEWLVDKYTSFSVDSTTFNDLRTKLDNYPMNFVVPGRPNILELLQEIAFQARCALVIRNDVLYMYYLSEEPAQDGTITESDVFTDTLYLDHTDTEQLVTKLTAEWKSDLAIEKPNRVIVRHNINRYGTQAQTFDFFCYNIQELVLKSATFWLIRMANTWRKVRCKVPVKHLTLESLDGVYVTLPDIANGQIKCRVETCQYNSGDRSVDMVIWTPVKSGTRDPYDFAYPAYVDVDEFFPTLEEYQSGAAGGSGPNVDVAAPSGHVLGNAPQVGSVTVDLLDPCRKSPFATDISGKCRNDQGDHEPSDTGDVKPTKEIGAGGAALPPSQSPRKEITIGEQSQLQLEVSNLQAQNANQQAQINSNKQVSTDNSNQLDEDSGNDTQPFDEMPDNPEGSCNYGVKVTFAHDVTAVFNGGMITTIEQDPGATGDPAIYSGPFTSETFWFCSASQRDEFYEEMRETAYNAPVQNGAESFVLFLTKVEPLGSLGCSQDECEEGQEGITAYNSDNKGDANRTDSLINYADSGLLTSDGTDGWDGVVRPRS